MNDNTYKIDQNSSGEASSSGGADRSGLEPQEKPSCAPCFNNTEDPNVGCDEDEPVQSFLELVYGVLFEPVKTLKKAARRPPLANALLLVTILGLAGVLMWLLTISRVLNQAAEPSAMVPLPSTAPLLVLGAVLIFLWGYIKWFSYSAFISLAAEMLGGLGSARNVAAVVGLSLIPTILMIPAQMLNYYLASAAFICTTILVVWIWVAALMVIGVREVHRLSTGRALLAVLSPVLVLAVFTGLLLAGLVAVAVSIFSGMNLPGYF
ncbi:Yip1 domain protein [Pelotomaculum schinkii]|uniref:Yip1 domain protein n=1 Tax=Pelotomaculum schinkii TaxID=78350 RepID=A0A4Y7R629_9FIRM|nr:MULTISPECIES: Yip1 family protein [Pelotomaculum]TEB04203.1 Yip1 domain protein [Pelotomaculum schinkii]TEB17771.1 Yip1 domain protein [Pelotomaculum sp. FP]